MNLNLNKIQCNDNKGTPPPKKFKVQQSSGTLMAIIFRDTEGILLIDYKEQKVSITKKATVKT